MNKGDVICVAVFGKVLPNLKSHTAEDWEQTDFKLVHCDSNTNISDLMINHQPNVFLSFGDWSSFQNLCEAPYEIRKKWINYSQDENDYEKIGNEVKNVFLNHTFYFSKSEYPLVSIITPTFNIQSKLFRTYNSLLEQTYKNWEWIIIDDSTDNNKTFEIAKSISETDHRVKLFKNSRNSGVIGELKHNGFSLAQGEYLAELDHDDELTTDCLSWVVSTFKKYPEAGMCYTDCTEFVESTGQCNSYGENYAFGYGTYRKEMYRGREYLVTNYPKINAKTIRHIVGVPNHIRVWRKDVYLMVGGHNRNLHVADDYELIVKTFLISKIAYIPKFGYIQNILSSSNNTTNIRRREIQRLVRLVRENYDKAIHNRILELGGYDFVWDEENQWSDIMNIPNEAEDNHFCIISDV